jgi:hypothetical protein
VREQRITRDSQRDRDRQGTDGGTTCAVGVWLKSVEERQTSSMKAGPGDLKSLGLRKISRASFRDIVIPAGLCMNWFGDRSAATPLDECRTGQETHPFHTHTQREREKRTEDFVSPLSGNLPIARLGLLLLLRRRID